MSFSNLSSELNVVLILSYLHHLRLEQHRQSSLFLFSYYLAKHDTFLVGFLRLFFNNLNNLKANDCNCDIAASIFSPQAHGVVLLI